MTKKRILEKQKKNQKYLPKNKKIKYNIKY